MNKYSVRFWEITELSSGHFIAEATEDNRLCYPETRLYFSRECIERDFGQLSEHSDECMNIKKEVREV